MKEDKKTEKMSKEEKKAKKATEKFSVAFLWSSHGQYTYFRHEK